MVSRPDVALTYFYRQFVIEVIDCLQWHVHHGRFNNEEKLKDHSLCFHLRLSYAYCYDGCFIEKLEDPHVFADTPKQPSQNNL